MVDSQDHKKHPIYVFLSGIVAGFGAFLLLSNLILDENYIKKENINEYLENERKTIISIEEKNKFIEANQCSKEETIKQKDIESKLHVLTEENRELSAKLLETQGENLSMTENIKELNTSIKSYQTVSCPKGIVSSNKIEQKMQDELIDYTKVTTHQGFKYALQSCKWSGEEILCEFIATNLNSRSWLAVHTESSFIQDKMSIPYKATWVKIAGSESEGKRSEKKNIFKSKQVRVFIKYSGYLKSEAKIADLDIKTSRGAVHFSDITIQ